MILFFGVAIGNLVGNPSGHLIDIKENTFANKQDKQQQ